MQSHLSMYGNIQRFYQLFQAVLSNKNMSKINIKINCQRWDSFVTNSVSNSLLITLE